MEKLYIVSKTRPGADCGSNHELLIAKFRLKLKKLKEESEKVGLKLSIQKAKIMTSGPITSWQREPTLCDPRNRSMPGFPVHHQLQEFTQTHVHRVNDAIQPSHPLSSPSPPAPNPSQHQSLFQ